MMIYSDRFSKWETPMIPDGRPTIYGWTVRHPSRLTLGCHTDIGYGTYIQAEHGITISDFCQIGAHCSLYTISTIDQKYGPITIGLRACVGAGSVVMPNVNIGDGAIVGALSFVNRSIPAWEVWGGVPARFIRRVEREQGIGIGK